MITSSRSSRVRTRNSKSSSRSTTSIGWPYATSESRLRCAECGALDLVAQALEREGVAERQRRVRDPPREPGYRARGRDLLHRDRAPRRGIDHIESDACDSRRTEPHLEHHPVGRLAFEDLRRVVQLAGRGSDRVMEARADARPGWIDTANAARTDDPARVGVRIVEYGEHRF